MAPLGSIVVGFIKHWTSKRVLVCDCDGNNSLLLLLWHWSKPERLWSLGPGPVNVALARDWMFKLLGLWWISGLDIVIVSRISAGLEKLFDVRRLRPVPSGLKSTGACVSCWIRLGTDCLEENHGQLEFCQMKWESATLRGDRWLWLFHFSDRLEEMEQCLIARAEFYSQMIKKKTKQQPVPKIWRCFFFFFLKWQLERGQSHPENWSNRWGLASFHRSRLEIVVH